MNAAQSEDAPADARSLTLEWLRLAAIFLCALIAALPFAVRGNSCGHDFDFHLQSWLSVTEQWHQGVLYPHWLAAANYNTGEPRMVFYPPASWMLGAALGSVMPWRAVPGSFVLLALSGCGLSFYKLAREWLPRDIAALAAAVYIVNPYALFVAYERTAFGELLAGVWLPLILLFALRGDAGLKRARSTVPLALCIAAVWLTNAPAAVMACYMLAVVAPMAALVERRWWPILRTAAGAALGIGLAAFYIVPAAYERRWVEIARAIGTDMRPQDSFLFGHTGEPFHDQILRTASWVAIAVLVPTAAAAFAAWRSGGLAGAMPRRVWTALLALPAVVLILLLPVSLPLWGHLPEMQFLQFPWRWLLVVGLSLAMLVGISISGWTTARVAPSGWHRRLIWAGPVLALLAVVAGSALYWQDCDEEDMVSAQIAAFHGVGIEGTDEYTTPGTDNEGIQQRLPPVRVLKALDDDEADSSVETNPDWLQPPDDDSQSPPKTAIARPADLVVSSWLDERKAFTLRASAPGFAVLRLLDYPAWAVRVNGIAIPARPHRADGLMALPIAPGVSIIEVFYRTTPDMLWGRTISVAALIVLLVLAIVPRRSRR